MLLILALSSENKKERKKGKKRVSRVSRLGGDFTGKYISKRTLKSSNLDSGVEKGEAVEGGRKSRMILLSDDVFLKGSIL